MIYICYVCVFENPAIKPGGNLQFTCYLQQNACDIPAAGFLGSRFLPLPTFCRQRQMKVECVKVSGERLELEIGEACFVSDLKVGKIAGW